MHSDVSSGFYKYEHTYEHKHALFALPKLENKINKQVNN